MQLKQLHYFSAVADCGSIAGAAKYLYISQPALTTSIKSLEKELGETLFYRTPHGVTLTAAGQYTLQIARQMADLEKTLLSHFTADRFAGYAGIRIMTLPFIKDYFLPNHIVEFYETFPQKSLELTCAGADVIIAHLLQNDIDLGFFAQIYCDGTPLYPVPEELRPIPFYSVKYAAAISPLCNLQELNTVSLALLFNAGYKMLLMEGANLNSEAVTKILAHYGLRASSMMTVDSFNLMERFLATTPSFLLSLNLRLSENQKFALATPLAESIICEFNYCVSKAAADNPFIAYFTQHLVMTV